MPANLTPQYKDAELRFREATSHEAKLDALREMLALLPKHKGTEKLYADLKRRLARLEDEGAHTHAGAAHREDPGHVPHEGAGQWALVGPPNSGKSALLAALTHAHPEIAAYPFTTRVPLAGMMPVGDVQVQLVDTPAVSAIHGEPWMTNLVHNADGVLVVLDPADDALADGVAAVRALLAKARVLAAGAPPPAEPPPFAVTRPVRVALAKSDADADGLLAEMAREALDPAWPVTRVSAQSREGLEALRESLWRDLRRIRVYAKQPGHAPDRERPFVLAAGATIEAFATLVHKDVAAHLKFARVWGHAAFDGQQVDRGHVLGDGDVVELHA